MPIKKVECGGWSILFGMQSTDWNRPLSLPGCVTLSKSLNVSVSKISYPMTWEGNRMIKKWSVSKGPILVDREIGIAMSFSGFATCIYGHYVSHFVLDPTFSFLTVACSFVLCAALVIGGTCCCWTLTGEHFFVGSADLLERGPSNLYVCVCIQ